MTQDFSKQKIDELVAECDAKSRIITREFWDTMYDDRSAEVNYAMIRYFRPKVVVEYGAYLGRCTHDILQALIDNGQPYVFKSYELNDDFRQLAQQGMEKVFGEKAIKIGGDVILAKDVPKKIDYLFLDHSHSAELSEWTWKSMIPKVKKGGIVQIHDIPLKNDYELGKDRGVFPETKQIIEMHAKGTLPFEKLYWLFPECGSEGSWWIKK